MKRGARGVACNRFGLKARQISFDEEGGRQGLRRGARLLVGVEITGRAVGIREGVEGTRGLRSGLLGVTRAQAWREQENVAFASSRGAIVGLVGTMVSCGRRSAKELTGVGRGHHGMGICCVVLGKYEKSPRCEFFSLSP